MTWTLRDAQRERAITDRIDQGDDRSAGILAGALIQDRLIKAIKARFVGDIRVQNLVFKGYGPLSDFRSQIDVAYLMNIIDQRTMNWLHVIRDIRNRFAHRLEAHDFTAQIIKDLCDKLIRIPEIQEIKALMLQNLGEDKLADAVSLWLGPIEILPDTPRNAYMATIKFILFWMEADTSFAELDRSAGGERRIILDLAVPSKQASLPGKSEPQPPPPPQNGNHTRRRRRSRPQSSPA